MKVRAVKQLIYFMIVIIGLNLCMTANAWRPSACVVKISEDQANNIIVTGISDENEIVNLNLMHKTLKELKVGDKIEFHGDMHTITSIKHSNGYYVLDSSFNKKTDQ